MVSKGLKCLQRVNMLNLKNHKKKIKASFVISADFEDNVKQNSNESYTNKYKKLVPCSYGYKLVCVDDKFSRPFKSYLGEDAVYNFINSIAEESKY